jgi:hypothetical protein
MSWSSPTEVSCSFTLAWPVLRQCRQRVSFASLDRVTSCLPRHYVLLMTRKLTVPCKLAPWMCIHLVRHPTLYVQLVSQAIQLSYIFPLFADLLPKSALVEQICKNLRARTQPPSEALKHGHRALGHLTGLHATRPFAAPGYGGGDSRFGCVVNAMIFINSGILTVPKLPDGMTRLTH